MAKELTEEQLAAIERRDSAMERAEYDVALCWKDRHDLLDMVKKLVEEKATRLEARVCGVVVNIDHERFSTDFLITRTRAENLASKLRAIGLDPVVVDED